MNRKANITIKIILALLVVCMTAIGVFVYHASLTGLLIFAAFIIFYVQLPGHLLLDTFRLRFNHLSSRLICSLMAGWALSVLLYFISELLNTDVLLYAYGPLLSITYIFLKHRAGQTPGSAMLKSGKFRPGDIPLSFCIFFVLILLYCLTHTQFQYLAPAVDNSIYLNPDKAYHLGLINSLSHSYPLESPWVSGVYITYHIFTEILYSIPVRLFGLEADCVLMTCGPYLTATVVCLSLYAFFREFSSRNERAGLYCLVVFLSNLYITRTATASLLYQFILTNDNAAGYGVSAFLVALIVLKYWYAYFSGQSELGCGNAALGVAGTRPGFNVQSGLGCGDAALGVAGTRPGFDVQGGFSCNGSASGNNHHLCYLILLIVMTMLTTGIKGPMGAVLVGAVWGTLILGLIMRKVKFRTVIPVLMMSAGFVLIYTTVLGSRGQSNASGDSVISIATISNIAFWKAPLVEFMKLHGIPYVARLGVVLLVFMIFLLTVFFIPFCIGYVRELVLVLSGRREFDFARIVVYAACFVGLAAMFILNYSGHSQVYFGLASMLLAPIIAFWYIEDLEAPDALHRACNTDRDPDAESAMRVGIDENVKASEPVGNVGNVKAGERVGNVGACGGRRVALRKAILTVCGLTLVLTSVSLCISFYKVINSCIADTDPDLSNSSYACMTNDEYEAMEWIRENTDKDALLANDRYFSVAPDEYSYDNRWSNRFFMYEVYANRFSYISGSGYNISDAAWQTRKEMIETNSELYDPDNENRGELAEELGVDYVIVSKRFTDLPSLENEDYERCYSNDDVDIYEVK